MTRRIVIAAAATLAGLVISVAFSELSGSSSNVATLLFFALALGPPVAYLGLSIYRRRLGEVIAAVVLGAVAWTVASVYILFAFSHGIENF